MARTFSASTLDVRKATVTSDQLIEAFESGGISCDAFHHADPVKLAFAYLDNYPVLQGLEKFSVALKRFATACGKPQLYNETITCAYFFLIRERMARGKRRDWEEFAESNPDLLIGKDGILSRYYCEATLKSDIARTTFVLPDKCLESHASCLELVRHQR